MDRAPFFRSAKDGTPMNGWEVLEDAIPRGEAEAVADLMGCSVDYVRRWCRPVEAGEEVGSGRRSPLDLILLFINAVYARNPAGAHMIVDRINSEIAQLGRRHGYDSRLSPEELEKKLRELSRQANEMADTVARERA